MKILILADEECPALWDFFIPDRLKDIDLILACGDLKADYLTFLVTMARCPVLYVHGNHDTGYLRKPPQGCDCIDDRVVVYNGIRILGLGGCRRYHPGEFQYTEKDMEKRIRRLKFPLWMTKGVDIVVTHAPPHGYGDADDVAHWGFQSLVDLMDKYEPDYLIHGHVHMSYDMNIQRECQYKNTRIINGYERYILEIPDKKVAVKDLGRIIWKNSPPKGTPKVPEFDYTLEV